MALRIVLIAAPFCILAILAVIDVFLRRGGGQGLGSCTALGNRGLLPSQAGQPQQPARPPRGHLGGLFPGTALSHGSGRCSRLTDRCGTVPSRGRRSD